MDGQPVGQALPWALEQHLDNPGVRYFPLTDVLDKLPKDSEAVEARGAVMSRGPVPTILGAPKDERCWEKPGAGYNPNYRSTVRSGVADSSMEFNLQPTLKKDKP